MVVKVVAAAGGDGLFQHGAARLAQQGNMVVVAIHSVGGHQLHEGDIVGQRKVGAVVEDTVDGEAVQRAVATACPLLGGAQKERPSAIARGLNQVDQPLLGRWRVDVVVRHREAVVAVEVAQPLVEGGSLRFASLRCLLLLPLLFVAQRVEQGGDMGAVEADRAATVPLDAVLAEMDGDLKRLILVALHRAAQEERIHQIEMADRLGLIRPLAPPQVGGVEVFA